jgi:hypothetical protein
VGYKIIRSLGHQGVNLPEDAHQFIPDDTHLLDRYLLDLEVPDDGGEAVVTLVLVLALHRLLHLAHLQVPVLLVDPTDALLYLHLDRAVLHVLQVPVLLPVLLDRLVAVVHLLPQLVVLQPAVVELVLDIGDVLHVLIGLLPQVLEGVFLVVESELDLVVFLTQVGILLREVLIGLFEVVDRLFHPLLPLLQGVDLLVLLHRQLLEDAHFLPQLLRLSRPTFCRFAVQVIDGNKLLYLFRCHFNELS